MKTLVGRVLKGPGVRFTGLLEWVDEAGNPEPPVAQFEFDTQADAEIWVENAAPSFLIPEGTTLWEKRWTPPVL